MGKGRAYALDYKVKVSSVHKPISKTGEAESEKKMNKEKQENSGPGETLESPPKK